MRRPQDEGRSNNAPCAFRSRPEKPKTAGDRRASATRNWRVDRSVDMIATGSFESEHSTLDTSAGAVSQIAAVVREAGLDQRFVECMQTYIAEAIAAGKGDVGNAVLFEHLRRR